MTPTQKASPLHANHLFSSNIYKQDFVFLLLYMLFGGCKKSEEKQDEVNYRLLDSVYTPQSNLLFSVMETNQLRFCLVNIGNVPDSYLKTLETFVRKSIKDWLDVIKLSPSVTITNTSSPCADAAFSKKL